MANTANVEHDALDLGNIRATLCRMEDSIIFSLIERAQYPINAEVYAPSCPNLSEYVRHQLNSAGSNGCYADHFLYQTECLHAEAGRYLHPTEHPFHSPLPDPVVGDPRACEPGLLHPHRVNINSQLLNLYRTKIIPEICVQGCDGNLGSVCCSDIQVLQTISTRIYYGLFVAEAKLRADRARFNQLIADRDEVGIMQAITKPEVEARNIERVVKKVATFSQEVEVSSPSTTPPSPVYKVSPTFVGSVFGKFIMPLTKQVEVEYLLDFAPILDPDNPGVVIKPPWRTINHRATSVATPASTEIVPEDLALNSPLAQHPLVQHLRKASIAEAEVDSSTVSE